MVTLGGMTFNLLTLTFCAKCSCKATCALAFIGRAGPRHCYTLGAILAGVGLASIGNYRPCRERTKEIKLTSRTDEINYVEKDLRLIQTSQDSIYYASGRCRFMQIFFWGGD